MPERLKRVESKQLSLEQQQQQWRNAGPGLTSAPVVIDYARWPLKRKASVDGALHKTHDAQRGKGTPRFCLAGERKNENTPAHRSDERLLERRPLLQPELGVVVVVEVSPVGSTIAISVPLDPVGREKIRLILEFKTFGGNPRRNFKDARASFKLLYDLLLSMIHSRFTDEPLSSSEAPNDSLARKQKGS